MEEILISYVNLCQLSLIISYIPLQKMCAFFYFAQWIFSVFFTTYSAVPTDLNLQPRFDRELQ